MSMRCTGDQDCEVHGGDCSLDDEIDLTELSLEELIQLREDAAVEFMSRRPVHDNKLTDQMEHAAWSMRLWPEWMRKTAHFEGKS